MQSQFPVNVYDPKSLVYQGNVWALSSVNEMGPFDLLALHTNFITVIQKQLILRFDEKNSRFLPVDLGVLRCYDQHVDVYLGISSHLI